MKTHILKIGDKTSDDSLIVIDEDRLCYQVQLKSKRTVP